MAPRRNILRTPAVRHLAPESALTPIDLAIQAQRSPYTRRILLRNSAYTTKTSTMKTLTLTLGYGAKVNIRSDRVGLIYSTAAIPAVREQ